MHIPRGLNLLALPILGSLALAAGAAFAQEASTSTPAPLAEVVVTGSRIPQPNTEAISPIQTVGQQEFQLQGTVDVESLLDNLPSVSPSDTQFSNGNAQTGIATVDLRGLGTDRTLVLVDGRRMPPGDAQEPVADLNLIPSALIDRVEVLTGGAASIYGSDAIAGVVNFIMKHDFKGLQIDAQYGFAQHDNDNAAADALLTNDGLTPPRGNTIQGRNTHVTVTFGSDLGDGKGNVEGYLSYINLQPVLQSAYDTEACVIASTFNNVGANGHFCLGSSNSAYGNFQGNFYGSENPAGNWLSSNTLNPVVQTLSNDPKTTNFLDYNNTPPGAASRAYNFAPQQYLQRQDTRYQGGFFAQYDVASHAQAYSDLMFEEDSATAQLAPGGLFVDNGPINQVNCDDPLMTAGQQQAMCGPNAGNANVLSNLFSIGYRFQNVPRDYQFTHHTFKMDVGVRGDINDAWSYDAYEQYGRADSSATTMDSESLSKIANALDAIPNGSGGAMCANAAAQAAGCVPLNIFQPLSAGVTPQQLAYIEENGTITGYTTEEVLAANFVGKLGEYGLKSPWADDGMGVAVGVDYRRDYLNDSPDATINSGDLSGTGSGGIPSVSGSTDVKEAYSELSVPVVADRFLMKNISVDGSYRWSDYNLAGASGTYKLGVNWEVTSDFRLRGAYARTERAPSVVELFIPQSIGGAPFTDPCAGASPSYSAAECYRSSNLGAAGISEAQFASNIYGHIVDCPAGACNTKTGGNPALTPEVAHTITFGVVLTPSSIRNLHASIDYWDIKIVNAVGTLSPNGILQGCYASNIATLCNDISRNPLDGSLTGASGYVLGVNQNLALIDDRGVDIQAEYRLPLRNWGSINTSLTGTYLNRAETSVPTEGSYDCAGLFGPTCGIPNPRWRHTVRSTWSTPWGVDLSLQWRYLAHVNADINSTNPILGGECCTIIDAKIPSYSYFDFATVWHVRDNIALRAGINNIMDKDPPVLDTIFLGLAYSPTNSWPGMYDPLGRTIFLDLTATL
ncbi:MAG: TonB-dependent receptor domain-containing protein [Steroidobacteraceae bacterium]